MSQSNYQTIALAFRRSKPKDDPVGKMDEQWLHDVDVMSAALIADNPRFKPSLFLAACGVDMNAENYESLL